MGDQDRVLLHLDRPSLLDQHSEIARTIQSLHELTQNYTLDAADSAAIRETVSSGALVDNEVLVMITRLVLTPPPKKLDILNRGDYSPGVKGDAERLY